ncbi:MAG: MBL fold metallo-hydrolase [Gemmatimonadales bacterium]|nr:MBL fold metallo-hydrolase [Gemmatimonadales bacterium]
MPERPFLARLAFARRYARSAVGQRQRELFTSIPPAPHRPDPARWPDDRLTAAWLGHATVLLNLFGSRILFDPALERRVGIGRGLAKLGPRRLIAPALRPRELPPLDLLLLSHAHMDHTDLGTLRSLPRDLPVLVQRGNRDLVRRFRNVTELEWGESAEVAGIHVESIEVRHWGARLVTDSHRGYGGFLLSKAGRTVVFAGDTAYTDAFARLRSRGPIDLAILPIGAYDPWIYNHASPEQAWQMFQALGAEYLLPIHHSTFRLSREPVDEPIRRLLAAAGSERWRVALTEVGETWSLP